MAESKKEFDLDYICAVLFPEHYPASRVPSKFSIPSALFTHKFSVYVSTEANGMGFISLLPLDTTFHCLYGVALGTGTAYTGNSSNDFVSECKYYLESDSRFIANNYS